MDDYTNPYGSPQSAMAEESPEAVKIIPVGGGLRFLNLIIDYIATFVMGIIFVVIVMLGWGEQALDELPDIALGIVLTLLYYIPMEALTGRTLGKFITGTRVVNE